MKKVYLAVASLAALLFAASYALPAAGAPSPLAEAAQLITGKQIANNTITGKKVKNRSLTPRDFRGSVRGRRGSRGPRGSAGPAGPQGPQGVPGPINASGLTTIVGPEATIPLADPVTGIPGIASSTAFCPAGQRVVSGGGSVNTAFADGLAVSRPNDNRTAWFVIAGNNSDLTTGTLTARALCAGAGTAVVARSDRSATRREVARIVAKMKARQKAER